MTMATLATAVTAIRRHMYEATNHQVSMNRHRLAAGQQEADAERVNQLIVGSTSSSLSSLRLPAAASSAASIRAA